MNNLEITDWGKWKIAWVQSSDVRSAIDAFKEGQVEGLGISSYHGFLGVDISFLEEISNDLTGLVFPRADDYDVAFIENFKSLRFLALTDPKQSLDLRQMSRLEDLSLDWLPQSKLPGASTPLRQLRLRRYKAKDNDLSELPAYSHLEALDLVHGNLTSLAGIERFDSLIKGDFAYMTKLETVEPLARTSVQELTFESCKKIKDLVALSHCAKLRILRYSSCADLESLSFLRSFHGLEEFRFVKVTVKDGDMTPLLKLKKVGFLKHRGYSHTPEQIREIIGEPPFHWDQTNLRIDFTGAYANETVNLYINDKKVVSKSLTTLATGGVAMSLKTTCPHSKNSLRVEIPRIDLERQIEIDLRNGDHVAVSFRDENIDISQTR